MKSCPGAIQYAVFLMFPGFQFSIQYSVFRAQGDSERLKGYTLVRDAATKNIEPLIFMCMCVVCGYREQRIDLRWCALVQSSERLS